MSFGFLGDIVEGIGDVILGSKGGGQRGARIGAGTAAFLGGDAATIARSAQYGSAISQNLSGKSAVSSPTVNQSPQGASESSMSGSDLFTYRPTFVNNFAGLPGPVRNAGSAAVGGLVENFVDMIPDINISKFFGGGMQVCGTKGMKLFNVTPNGCLSITRKQQHQLKNMIEYIGIRATADAFGLSVEEVSMLASKRFPPRRKGITASQLRNAKRVNRTIMGMAKQLTDACKTTTTRRR
jgi:hypothetical protein